MTINNR